MNKRPGLLSRLSLCSKVHFGVGGNTSRVKYSYCTCLLRRLPGVVGVASPEWFEPVPEVMRRRIAGMGIISTSL